MVLNHMYNTAFALPIRTLVDIYLKCFFASITIKIFYLINDDKNADIFAIQ